MLLGCAAVWLLLNWKWIPLPAPNLDLLQRAIRATVFIVVVLAMAKAISVYGIGRVEEASTSFTLRRILHLGVGVVIVFIGLSIFFANWYSVNELEVRAHPRVFFRVDEVTWIDAIVRYVVAPREAGAVKTRLIPKLLAALNTEPDKVMFPAGNAR